jgi:hypothetical protein
LALLRAIGELMPPLNRSIHSGGCPTRSEAADGGHGASFTVACEPLDEGHILSGAYVVFWRAMAPCSGSGGGGEVAPSLAGGASTSDVDEGSVCPAAFNNRQP